MCLTTIKDIATIIGVIIAIIGILPIVRNLQLAAMNYRFKVYTDLLKMLEETREERTFLKECIQNQKGGNIDLDKLSEPDRKKLEKLARAFDNVGLLVSHGAVPRAFLYDYYSRPIILAWKHLKPMIEMERQIRMPKQPNHMLKFQMLAMDALFCRRSKYLMEISFEYTDPEFQAWREWKRQCLRRRLLSF